MRNSCLFVNLAEDSPGVKACHKGKQINLTCHAQTLFTQIISNDPEHKTKKKSNLNIVTQFTTRYK